ncbi:MAG: flagellar biosynthetic protein FliR [Deltaproteobacteria bacterium]
MAGLDILMGGMLIKIEVFLLVLVRMSSLFIISPIFGRRNVPTIFKIGFALMVSIILINVVKLPLEVNLYGMYEFSIAIFKEFIIGLILGYIGFVILSAIYLAGQLIDTQIGFSIVSVIDPISNIQVPITATLYYGLTIVIFLTINGHHMLIDAIVRSFDVIPIGLAVFSQEMIPQLVQIMGMVFIIAFKISAPIIAAALICDVALGILSRTMPQMNIFFVGMPLKIVLGLAAIMITLPAFISLVGFSIDNINEQTNIVMNLMTSKKAGGY